MRQETPSLRITLFGRFEVQRLGESVPETTWPRSSVRQLLKVLLTQPGHVFTCEQLAEFVLPGTNPTAARRNVHSLVSRLRRILEPGLERGNASRYIIRSGGGYYVSTQAGLTLDTEEFVGREGGGDAAVAANDDSLAAAEYEAAFRLYQGDFLEEDRYEEWTLDLREAWRERHAGILVKLGQCYARAGDYQRAAAACRRSFEIRPWHDATMRELMTYYYAAGDRAEALHVFSRGSKAMLEYLDVAPSEESRSLHQRIVDHLPLDGLVVPSRTRIAVLPLVCIGVDPRIEVTAGGLTEQLIFALSQVAALHVIAQTSILVYKDSRKRASRIARELGVGSLLEGSVRAVGDTIRVTLQLIDGATEGHLWAATYDWHVNRALDGQTRVAQEVATVLSAELEDADTRRIARTVGSDSAGYAHYLKGRYFLGRPSDPDTQRAVECFQAAIAADPGFALAHAALADAIYLGGLDGLRAPSAFARAKEAADRALATDGELAEAHAAKAASLWLSDDDPEAAGAHFRRAFDLNSRSVMAHLWYGRFLLRTKQAGNALVEFLKALEIDPLSPLLNTRLASALGFERRHEEALYYFGRALDVDASLTPARLGLAFSLRSLYDWESAEREIVTAIANAPSDPFAEHAYAWHLQSLRRTKEARAHQARSLELARPPYSVDLAYLYAGQFYCCEGEYDRAIDYLERALDANPLLRSSHHWMCLCYALQGDAKKAAAALKEAEKASGRFLGYPTPMYTVWTTYTWGLIHVVSGRMDKARRTLHDLQRLAPVSDRSLAIGALLTALGDTQEALRWLERSVEERDHYVPRIGVFPMFERLHGEPRFETLLRRMGLPPSTQQAD